METAMCSPKSISTYSWWTARPRSPVSLEVRWGHAIEFWPWNVGESDACRFQIWHMTKVPWDPPHPLSSPNFLLDVYTQGYPVCPSSRESNLCLPRFLSHGPPKTTLSLIYTGLWCEWERKRYCLMRLRSWILYFSNYPTLTNTVFLII